MRKKVIVSLVLFYAASFILISLNTNSFGIFLRNVYNADILFPFSLYQGLFSQTSHTDWVFGGYTPFIEILAGFIFWFFSRHIHTTFLLYAIFQPILLTFSLLFLAHRIFGRNAKVTALIVIFSALPIYLFAFGQFPSAWPLFTWYLHITTMAFSIMSLGLLIQQITSPSQKNSKLSSWVILIVLIVIASMSDALFIAQFTIPAVLMIIFFIFMKLIPFRRGAYAGLAVLYATAAGLVLYRLPSLWGSDRLVFYGSYIRPSVKLIVENLDALVKIIPGAWDGSLWGNILWVLFYLICSILFLTNKKYIQEGLSSIRGKLAIVYAFFFIQMVMNIGSGLVSLTLGTRYFLPIIFVPLFWGWPFVLLARPAWIRYLRGQRMMIPVALSVVTILILSTTNSSPRSLPELQHTPQKFVECLDEKSVQYRLHRGMANYWQARPVTLLSKTGLVVVQVDPDLKPFRILNNSDGYRDDFDFVIISNNMQPGYWMDRNIVLSKFGQPASTFFCEKSEILVYNRESDTQIKNHFDAFFAHNE